MKKLLIILGLTVPLLLATARAATPEQTDKALNEFFAKYSGRKGYTTMELTGELLKASYGKNQRGTGNGDMFNGVEYMRIVVAEENTAEFTLNVIDLPGKTDLKLMTNVSENGKTMKIYYKPAVPSSGSKKKRNAEFLMLILGHTDNILINISGDFDINNVSKLSGLGIKPK